MKNRNEKLTLEEARKLLLIINSVYRQLYILYDEREILPLENMDEYNGDFLVSIPDASEHTIEQVAGSETYIGRHYNKKNLQPLWERYQGEFEKLGIDIRKYDENYKIDPHFEICVRLKDISDLPIDYEKVTLLTKEEMKKIIGREEGDER